MAPRRPADSDYLWSIYHTLGNRPWCYHPEQIDRLTPHDVSRIFDDAPPKVERRRWPRKTFSTMEEALDDARRFHAAYANDPWSFGLIGEWV